MVVDSEPQLAKLLLFLFSRYYTRAIADDSNLCKCLKTAYLATSKWLPHRDL